MASGVPFGAVTYQQMVEYVGRVTDPIEAHMSTHDAWHLQRLTVEQQAARSYRLAMIGVWVAVAALVASIVIGVAFRH